METTEPCKMSNRPHPASRRWTAGLAIRRPNHGTIGVKPMGAVLCFEFACSCQTGAPPTQGRAGAKSYSIWWQPMHRMLRRGLHRGRTPHYQWTQGMWVKMSSAETTYFENQPPQHPHPVIWDLPSWLRGPIPDQSFRHFIARFSGIRSTGIDDGQKGRLFIRSHPNCGIPRLVAAGMHQHLAGSPRPVCANPPVTVRVRLRDELRIKLLQRGVKTFEGVGL